MVIFVESVQFNPDFAKAVYDAFYDPEREQLDFYGKRLSYKKKWEGWPEHLDMENFDLVGFGSDHLTFQSGGDWQEGASVSLYLKKGKLCWVPFDAYTKRSRIEIKCACKDLINCAEGQINEDCQIAGSMMGDVPQNIGSVLSLGYKTGRVLPSPKKKADAKDYSSIP